MYNGGTLFQSTSTQKPLMSIFFGQPGCYQVDLKLQFDTRTEVRMNDPGNAVFRYNIQPGNQSVGFDQQRHMLAYPEGYTSSFQDSVSSHPPSTPSGVISESWSYMQPNQNDWRSHFGAFSTPGSQASTMDQSFGVPGSPPAQASPKSCFSGIKNKCGIM